MRSASQIDEELGRDELPPTETTLLLSTSVDGASTSTLVPSASLDRGSVKEIETDNGDTTWKHEAAIIGKSALPLIATFFLQYSLTVASIFSVGHLGKNELGGVSLAQMSANVFGYVIYQGLATSLDTLCAQAYGSGKKELVGIYTQRMLLLFSLLTIPIALVWINSEPILYLIIPDKEVAYLASLYLKVLVWGAPGYFAFECGKRFMQAQGLFYAATYVMLFCAPLNAFMNWYFVWKLEWGFVGAPIAVAITDTILPLGLVLYAYFVDGSQCWGGFSKKAFSNWPNMIRLAFPGFVMLEAEFCAFEILTFAAAQIDTRSLAAQSVLMVLQSTAFYLAYPVSIAGGTRIGNLVGAGFDKAAIVTTKVLLCAGVLVALFNLTILTSLRYKLPYLINSEVDVVKTAGEAMPVIAGMQIFDVMSTISSGVIRGVGRQYFSGATMLVSYYAIGIPISFITAFKLNWGLLGLWSGVALALALVAMVQLIYIRQLNWGRVVNAAAKRTAQG